MYIIYDYIVVKGQRKRKCYKEFKYSKEKMKQYSFIGVATSNIK